MYRISEFSELVGLSRTALLYYEKLNLISAKRLENGYRVYDQMDLQQVRLIQQLQNGGLTLAECKSCLHNKLDKSVLYSRYLTLGNEIEKKQRSLHLLAGLLGKSTNKNWHETLAEIAPDAHLDWLKVQGYDEKEALRIKWLSKDMNEHEKYMQDFFSLFNALELWGPNSKEDTTRAFELVNYSPESILEIGCGKGHSTMTLAALSDAQIVAIDNEPSVLQRLDEKIRARDLNNRVSTQCISMTELNFNDKSFDLIWAEASIYIMGVENALSAFKPLLKENGFFVFSDLVWLTDSPSDAPSQFWQREYPDMQRVETRLEQIDKAGYQNIASFEISQGAWKAYYEPLQNRLDELEADMNGSQALLDIQEEVNLYKTYLGEFGYQFFIAQKR